MGAVFVKTAQLESLAPNTGISAKDASRRCFSLYAEGTNDAVGEGYMVRDCLVTSAHVWNDWPKVEIGFWNGQRVKTEKSQWTISATEFDTSTLTRGQLKVQIPELQTFALVEKPSELPPGIAGQVYVPSTGTFTPCRLSDTYHNASTVRGHSGSPVIVNGRLFGMHIAGCGNDASGNTMPNRMIPAAQIGAVIAKRGN